MAVTYSDKNLLSTDAGFQSRVRASMISNSLAVTTESFSTAFHRERQTYAVQVLNAPDTYKPLFANTVATDTAVINDATQNGTVTLASSNLATQAALVTDAHIDSAISSQYNSFFRTPAA